MEISQNNDYLLADRLHSDTKKARYLHINHPTEGCTQQ